MSCLKHELNTYTMFAHKDFSKNTVILSFDVHRSFVRFLYHKKDGVNVSFMYL